MEIQDLVGDMEKKANLVNQFCAEFSKTRQTAVFNREVTVQGRLVFQKPNKFLLNMKGDVNVELLSDGAVVHLIHDNRDQEVFQVEGERDLSRFADPLMLLIDSIGRGGLRKFRPVRNESQDHTVTMEFLPGNENHFERIRSVVVQLSAEGQIGKVVILSKDGERDEVVFRSWRMLAQDDPEIRQLDERLKLLTKCASGRSETAGPDAVALVRNSQRPTSAREESTFEAR
jgi:outer membrane lipoprotein-sorting protein